jgi:hypothetical protein
MNVCDVRSMRGAEIESGHFLVTAKIRPKIKKSKKTKKSEKKKWDIGQLNKEDSSGRKEQIHKIFN